MRSNKELGNTAFNLLEQLEEEAHCHNEQLFIIKLMEQIINLRNQIELTKEMVSQQYQSFVNKLNNKDEQKH